MNHSPVLDVITAGEDPFSSPSRVRIAPYKESVYFLFLNKGLILIPLAVFQPFLLTWQRVVAAANAFIVPTKSYPTGPEITRCRRAENRQTFH